MHQTTGMRGMRKTQTTAENDMSNSLFMMRLSRRLMLLVWFVKNMKSPTFTGVNFMLSLENILGTR